MSDDISYEEHVQQNNQRLISIRNSLTELSSFQHACTELTQWCSDQRAFSACFEDNLIFALEVAAQNGVKEGYDFTLAHQLITTCFSHRKLLSKNSATRINRWYEQFRRLKKSGGKKKKKPADAQSGAATSSTAVVVTLPIDPIMDQMTVTDSGSMWGPPGCMPAAAGPSPMQSPAYPQSSSGAAAMMPMQYGMQPSPYPPMDPSGARPPQYANDPTGMYEQNVMQQQMQHQRMMMMQQQMHQQQQQHAAARVRRTASQQQMSVPSASHAGYPDAMYQNIPMGANSAPGQTQPLMRVASQPGMPSPGYPGMMPQQPRQPGMMSPAYPNNPQMIRAGPPMLFGQMQQPAQQQQVVSYPNPNAPMGNIPPMMTEPVPYVLMMKEVLLKNFHLEHQVVTTNIPFNVSPELMRHLSAPYCDIQLKCFHKEDRREASHWPIDKDRNNEIPIVIACNGKTLPSPAHNRSIYLKSLVLPGQNTLTFTVLNNICVCSHFFALRAVFRKSVQMITQDIFQISQQKGVTPEACKQKLQNFAAGATSTNCTLEIPLTCQLTKRRMRVPARFDRCLHAACFDLEACLSTQTENSYLQCPICSVIFSMDQLEIDLFVGAAIRETMHANPPPIKMLLNASGSWQACSPASPGNPENNNNNNSGSTSNHNRKRKNETDSTTAAPGVSGPAHPMKRIKSEPFPMAGNTMSSPFPAASSVPNGGPFGQSPAPSMMSPFTGTTSPMKAVSSPAGARFLGGPGTPLTPNHAANPSSEDVKPSLASLQEAMHSGNSPQQPMAIQQHGSVETPSLTGSAPYTPASLSSGTTTVTQSSDVKPFASLSNVILDLDVVSEGLIRTNSMTADDIRKYLNDTDFTNFEDLADIKTDYTSTNQWDWEDLKGVIDNGAI